LVVFLFHDVAESMTRSRFRVNRDRFNLNHPRTTRSLILDRVSPSMKRYRILPFFADFDTRSLILTEPISEEWEEHLKAQHRQDRENTVRGLKAEFGEVEANQKIQNFVDIGSKPFSIIAFHNAFFAQVRSAFVMGSYYPALTGVCALGERILNHLILALREDFKLTSEYKKVYRKDSFDDWSLAIDTLVAWDVLLPVAADDFRVLMRKRHEAIHFRPETDLNVRQLALDAVTCLQKIIGEQFSGYGLQPWFITGIPGEIYIKKTWESKPFISKVYLQNGLLLGPHHRIEFIHPQLQIIDPDHNKDCLEISDDEFVRIRKEFNDDGQKG
jgi:hypothetical protein